MAENLRRCRRAVALGWALLVNLVDLAWMRRRGPLDAAGRAVWLQAACRRVLWAFGGEVRVHGIPPAAGLVVANHLSHLDIPIFSSAMPCVFVSKLEVRKWPYFGFAARVSGTIFIDRTSRAGAAAAAAEMRERLKLPVPVLLFPEGTSSDGSQVLRFHSSLFQPAVDAGAPVTAAAVRYLPDDGSAESDLCWFGDTGFMEHLWRLLGGRGFQAEIHFGEPQTYAERRLAAQSAHQEVEALRSEALEHSSTLVG